MAGHVDNGEHYSSLGAEDIREIFVLSAQFCCEIGRASCRERV